jgi:hypothetical protein
VGTRSWRSRPELTSRAAAEATLQDWSGPISLSSEGTFMTFGAVAIELSVPPTMRVAPGPPHETPFETIAFSA